MLSLAIQPPVIDRLTCCSERADFVAIVDRETGSVHTHYDTEDSLENSVAVADDWLYANTDRTLYGLTTCETELFGRCLR
ncbi:hypothetical protein C482_07496 [Natrialba chahannaoensis JCM 10990]|uniref:Uncharacterized protein n=1 Tax=Natrialba chahannaoensis JCM 10990 TaxID=1227492 RepID=M0ARZ4_9EURY|nr:hypothetical protein C482_07496 [Natrialba chahannaoensis JCM 10990]